MKKILISAIIIITMLFNTVYVFAAPMQSDYPESAHNYSNDLCDEWNYSYDGDAEYLAVTFSQDTYFGPGGEDYYDEESDEYLCDYVEIYYDSDYRNIKRYFSDELAGKTILIPDSGFSISLVTNDSGNYYGFKITDISSGGGFDDFVFIKYKINENIAEKSFVEPNEDGSLMISYNFKNNIIGNKAIIGWKDDKGHEYLYRYDLTKISRFQFYRNHDEYTDVFDVKPGEELVLTPIYTTVSINPEETFSFYNSDWNFKRGYRMTHDQAKQLKNCYKSASKDTEFKMIGAVLGFLLKTVYQICPWDGSCCGFPIAILMQHYGMIDLCSSQSAASLNRLAPTKEITGALNFYNAVTPAAIMCSHKAAEPGSEQYKAQTKNLYETVSGGRPVVCFINCGYVSGISYENSHTIIKGIFSQGLKKLMRTHCVLFTGAYIDGNGNQILIGYDENDASYHYGKPQIYAVNDDYSDICEIYGYGLLSSLDDIAWFDDASFLESFKADGETDSSAWYSYYCANKDKLS